jgi:two-component system, OmpR family, phosphate regulon sensor histidine kinase PhoR
MTFIARILGRQQPRPEPLREAAEQVALPARAFLDALSDPAFLLDRQGVLIEANDHARTFFPALRLGAPLSSTLRMPDVLESVKWVLADGEATTIEYMDRVPFERWTEAQIGLVQDEAAKGEPRVLILLRDLTAVRRAERMRVDFVANASHELRTPLASLLGFVETLQGPARDDTVARARFLEIMRLQAMRMARLIDDLLSLSRIELRAHMRPDERVDLVSVARQVVDALMQLAQERGISLTIATEAQSLLVRGDRDELIRVVENLLENAIKYGASGERVDVEVRPSSAGSGEIMLSVRDYGAGIAPEHLPRLTERFYRVDVSESRDKGGTGLGLALVKHIIARHRGRLDITSKLGEGACFAVHLPAVEPASVGEVDPRHRTVTEAS